MIVIIGPDQSGKTTLAQSLESAASKLGVCHFDQHSSYDDYLKPLCSLELIDGVLDRCHMCEYPYHKVMGREFRFSLKEWHNLTLLMLMQNPLVILCTHKPQQYEYKTNQYLPYDKWDECLRLYRHFLNSHHIEHIEYDYNISGVDCRSMLLLDVAHAVSMKWWTPMWKAGYGAIGSTYPKALIVAERLGPNNVNNLPFETGPTGRMMSDMLFETRTPLGKITITNLVKSFRRDTRPPNDQDLTLLSLEIQALKPDKVVFMGTPAKKGIPVAKKLGVPYFCIPHLGYFHHKGVKDMSSYYTHWRIIMGMIK